MVFLRFSTGLGRVLFDARHWPGSSALAGSRPIDAFTFQHQERFHHRRLDRFNENDVDACCDALLAGALIRVSRNPDDEALLPGKVESQLARYLAPVQKRHGNIQQHDVGVVLGRDSQGGDAIVRQAGSVPPATNQPAECISRVLVVVHHQDAEHSASWSEASDPAGSIVGQRPPARKVVAMESVGTGDFRWC
jgi:hypothetical protein